MRGFALVTKKSLVSHLSVTWFLVFVFFTYGFVFGRFQESREWLDGNSAVSSFEHTNANDEPSPFCLLRQLPFNSQRATSSLFPWRNYHAHLWSRFS